MNYFTIYFSDLTLEAQESIRKLVADRIKDDPDKMKEIEELASKKAKGFDPEKRAEIIDSLIEEEIDDQINRLFDGKGEV